MLENKYERQFFVCLKFQPIEFIFFAHSRKTITLLYFRYFIVSLDLTHDYLFWGKPGNPISILQNIFYSKTVISEPCLSGSNYF